MQGENFDHAKPAELWLIKAFQSFKYFQSFV